MTEKTKHIVKPRIKSIKNTGFDTASEPVICIIAITVIQLMLGFQVKIFGGDTSAFGYYAVVIWFVSVIPIIMATLLDGDLIFSSAISILMEIGFGAQSMLNNSKKFAFSIIAANIAAYVFSSIFIKVCRSKRASKILLIMTILSILGSVVIFALLFIFRANEEGTIVGINIGGTTVQIQEFIKVTYGIILTFIVSSDKINDKKKLVLSTINLICHSVGFIYMHELGSLLVIAVVTMLMIFIYIDNFILLVRYESVNISILASMVLAVYFAASLKSKNVITANAIKLKLRWDGHFNPAIGDAGYQIRRAILAISEGGLFGSKSHIYTPLYNSDMVYVYLILRLGIFVAFAVFLMYLIIFKRTQHISEKLKGNLFPVICLYMGSTITVQALIIIFGSTNYTILTGIPLPFISSGGVSYIVFMSFAMSVLLSSCTKSITLKEDGFMLCDKNTVLEKRTLEKRRVINEKESY